MICIYHNRDLDGYCSGAIVKKWFDELPKDYPDKKLSLIGWDYGRPIPEVPVNEKMIMVDISFPMETMEVFNKTNNLVWIDHHVSAIKEYESFFKDKNKIAGERNTGFAACELTWNYFYPGRTTPLTVFYLGVYDSWRNNDLDMWNNYVMPFQYGMRMICNSIDSFPQEFFDLDEHIELIVENGKLLLKYQNQQNEGLCRLAFERRFKGLNAICVNASGTGSQTFLSVWNPDKYDLMISFFYNGHHDFYTVSLYSDKSNIDCSILAKEMGGGGHKGAAGFQIYDFKKIFDKNEV